MYNKGLLAGFLVLFSGTPCLTYGTQTSKNPEYAHDEAGNTLVFRRQPLWYDVKPVMSVFFIGLGYLISRAEFKPENGPFIKPVSVILPFGVGSLGLGHFLYTQYRMKDPILILSDKGIWHEPWDTQLLWHDIIEIECKKIDQYVTRCLGKDPILIQFEQHIGFSWEIRLHTKHKVWTIDERSTQIWNTQGTGVARPNDSLEKDSQELWKLIREYYDKGTK